MNTPRPSAAVVQLAALPSPPGCMTLATLAALAAAAGLAVVECVDDDGSPLGFALVEPPPAGDDGAVIISRVGPCPTLPMLAAAWGELARMHAAAAWAPLAWGWLAARLQAKPGDSSPPGDFPIPQGWRAVEGGERGASVELETGPHPPLPWGGSAWAGERVRLTLTAHPRGGAGVRVALAVAWGGRPPASLTITGDDRALAGAVAGVEYAAGCPAPPLGKRLPPLDNPAVHFPRKGERAKPGGLA